MENYYDYDLQAWILGGKVRDCNHPQETKDKGCCNGHRFAGMEVTYAQAVKEGLITI